MTKLLVLGALAFSFTAYSQSKFQTLLERYETANDEFSFADIKGDNYKGRCYLERSPEKAIGMVLTTKTKKLNPNAGEGPIFDDGDEEISKFSFVYATTGPNETDNMTEEDINKVWKKDWNIFQAVTVEGNTLISYRVSSKDLYYSLRKDGDIIFGLAKIHGSEKTYASCYYWEKR